MEDLNLTDRRLGGIVGAGVGMVPLILSSWLPAQFGDALIYGIPIGAFVGYAMAPQVLRARSLARPAIDSAVVAVLAGIIVYTVAGLLLLGTWPFVYLPLLPLIGLIAFLFGMPVALPAAFLGGFVLRKIAKTWPSALR